MDRVTTLIIWRDASWLRQVVNRLLGRVSTPVLLSGTSTSSPDAYSVFSSWSTDLIVLVNDDVVSVKRATPWIA